ncbi:MAG: hypothetical protein PF795_09260, partial [Kiritimatiellae bacterium]|nr:hypothetical protein [Kiritimatiellia bacterium]
MTVPMHTNKFTSTGHFNSLTTMIVILLLILQGCQTSNKVLDRKTLFNDGWKFQLGDFEHAMEPNYDDSDWQEVDLPHDWA